MNAKMGRVLMLAVATLLLGSFSLEQPTPAQSARGPFAPRGNFARATAAQSANGDCRSLRGDSLQVFDPATGVVSGPVTNAGFLNGTLEDVIDFDAGFVFTPDPNVVAYTTDLTITTAHGQLRASPVTTQSVLTGVGAEWASIDPDASTGWFAGATGTIYITFKPVGDPSTGPYESEISGEICFAR